MIRILQSVDYHYDEQTVPNATMEDLDLQGVRAFMAESKDLDPADGDVTRYLRALKCLDAKGTPTVSGILFFGKNPTRWLPDARISAVRFRGTVMAGDFADRKEIEGRLPAQIEAAIAFLTEHVPAPASIEGFARVERGIPAEVMREALTNAVIHRDYRATSQVRVFVFDDRVEFVNPGALLNQLTLDSIRLGGISQRRNPVICSLTARAGRRELYGLGVPQMIRLMRERGLPDPDFSLDGGHFRVVLRCCLATSA
jgi:ATP-dependent DNA helicase RecG